MLILQASRKQEAEMPDARSKMQMMKQKGPVNETGPFTFNLLPST